MRKNICRLERDSLKRLQPLIASYQFNDYRQYQTEKALLDGYILDGIDNLLSNRNNFALAAEEKGVVVGLAAVERLDWDTKYFGMPMARITHLMVGKEHPHPFELKRELISRILSECHQEKIHHLTARVPKEDTSSIHALESKGFRLMDVIVTAAVDFRRRTTAQIEQQWTVRQFNSDDMPKLVDIAIEAFKEHRIANQRFHADPWLPKEKSENLYVQWLINASKGLADTILVAEMNGSPVGFSACRVERQLGEKIGVRIGVIFLTAVKPSVRRRGVHTSMLYAALDWFSDKVDFVEIGAEVSNYAAQSGWKKPGFKIVRAQCTFHWFNPMDSSFGKRAY